MPPTVKSLEERIDDLADDMRDMKAQLASLTSGLSTLQAQLSALTARLDAVTAELSRTNTRLDAVTTRLDGLVTDFAAFRGRTEANLGRLDAVATKFDVFATDIVDFRGRTQNSLGVARWAIGLAASALLTAVSGGFWLAREAGKVYDRVQTHQTMLENQQKVLEEIRLNVTEIKARQK